jgi:hypothetical protein
MHHVLQYHQRCSMMKGALSPHKQKDIHARCFSALGRITDEWEKLQSHAQNFDAGGRFRTFSNMLHLSSETTDEGEESESIVY